MSSAAEEAVPARPRVVFSVMGDVPYAPAEVELLPKQIADIPPESSFVVHLGDIKTGKSACEEPVYATVAKILAQSKRRVFIIPGDNEWNDCVKPDEGWALWQKYFRRFDQNWKSDLSIVRQSQRDENFAFTQANVLFIGINLVGGRVHDESEWRRRHAENVEWTRGQLAQHRLDAHAAVIFAHAHPTKHHDDYMQPLFAEAAKFEKQILFLHGDGHKWIYDRPYAAKNILRIQVDQGGIAPPLKVTVTDDPQNPFVVDRRQ